MRQSLLRIATRQSPLALWQAEWVKNQLQTLHPFLHIELLGMTTLADRMIDKPLSQVGGKGLFVKELEEALLEGRADLAVHSVKDMPMVLPPTLRLPVICPREDPRDALVSKGFSSLDDLPIAATIGTSSLRRQSQLLAYRPDLCIKPLRGNINTRLLRLDDAEYDAIVLAAAGLKRLGLAQHIQSYLSTELSLPAPGQGALGLECRAADTMTQALILPLNHVPSYQTVTAERAVCMRLGASCQAPVAAFSELSDDHLVITGLVACPTGKTVLKAQRIGAIHEADILGYAVADDLLQQGAAAFL